MTSDSLWGRTERRLALIAFAAVVVLIVVFLLRDASAFVNSAHDELIGHIGASAGFTVAATGTLLVLQHRRPDLLAILVAGAAITLAAELAQGLVPARGVQLRDLATGFGGVLLAAVCIEVVLRLFSLLKAMRVHMVVASIASAILLVLLVFDLAPDNVSDARPTGDPCPLSTGVGSGARMLIGAADNIVDGCLRTDAGGLGLFGPNRPTALANDTVLLTSPLDQLVEGIVEDGRFVVRSAFVTDNFDAEFRPPGVMVILRSIAAGELLQVRMRGDTVEVIGPSVVGTYRGFTYTQVLEPSTRYVLEVEITRSTMQTSIDGTVVAMTSLEPTWIDALAASEAASDMTMYIANGSARTLPFHGLIEWIEVDT